MSEGVRQVGVYQVFARDVSIASGTDQIIAIDTSEKIDTALDLFVALTCLTADTGNVAYDLTLKTHAGQVIENITGNVTATAGADATLLSLPFTVTDAIKFAASITGTFTFPSAASYTASLMLGGVPLN